MSASRFSYQPIKHKDEIRVIVLHSGAPESSISCTLKHVRLGDRPRYEALSYTWGSSEKERSISIDGNQILITKSLYIALENLRHHGPSLRRFRRDRIIWADALCINQDDDAEKSVQVAMMGKIYSMAFSVRIWIGEDPSAEAKGAFNAIRKADRFLRKHAANYRPKLRKEQVGYRDSHADDVEMSTELIIEIAGSGLEVMEPLLDRSWYGRMWIVQEAVLGHQPVIQCGKESMDWTTFGAVAEALWSLGVVSYVDFALNRKSLERIATIYSIQQNIKSYYDDDPELTILDLVDTTGDFACFDPRDGIFALLSLTNANGFTPQYSRSVVEVFTDFSKWALQRFNNLDILSYAGLVLRSDGSSSVPSWSISPSSQRDIITFLCAQHFHASSEHQQSPFYINNIVWFRDSSLILQGTLLDGIRALGEPLCSESRRPAGSTDIKDTMPFGDEWYEWLNSTLSLGDPNYSSLPVIERHNLYSAMYCNLGQYGEPAEPESSQWVQWLLDDLQNPSRTKHKAVEHNDEIDAIDVNIGKRATRRRFCVTKGGHYAWIPEIAELEDEIFLLLGARVPFVLRRQGPSQYSLIGEAWVQGFMEGEALVKGVVWSQIELL